MADMRELFPVGFDELDDQAIADIYSWPDSPVNRPWIRTNFAHTVDGSFADAQGLSAGVSNPADKRVFAILRATCDAVLVGAGTARAEEYGPVTIRENLRSIRESNGRTNDPRLVVVTSSGNVGPTARDVATLLKVGDGPTELADAMSSLADQGIERVLCEGGPHLVTDLLAANLVDDLCMTTSPLLLGTGNLSLLTMPLEPPRGVALASLVEEDGTLMARWTVRR